MRNELKLLAFVLGVAGMCSANAEVRRSDFGKDDFQINVSGEDWHPEGFEHGTSVTATYLDTVSERDTRAARIRRYQPGACQGSLHR